MGEGNIVRVVSYGPLLGSVEQLYSRALTSLISPEAGVLSSIGLTTEWKPFQIR